MCADIHVNITVYQPAFSVDPYIGRSEKTRTLTLLAIMKKRVSHLTVQATTRVVVLKLVKVRAHIRFRLGRKEKVRSHWRRYRVACSETSVTVSK